MEKTTEYLKRVQQQFSTGIAREHAYRGYLQTLLEHLCPDVLVTNEPARVKCGAPDYILTRKNIPVGYIEAKDVGKPLDSKDYIEQFDRYKESLDNLIITDYLEFRFYRAGELVAKTQIGEIQNGKIEPLLDNFEQFDNLIRDFSSHVGQTITSPSKLSKMMAGKARLLANIIETAVSSDEESGESSTLNDQLDAFRNILIHDIDAKQFSDIYAQTIAYGMFAARLHDASLEDFSRQEAAELIPKTNPFLRNLFGYIAGPNLDDRILWVVDELADIFRATDVAKILEGFGKATKKHDPIIHFYETFLSEYDPALRKSRGVWYTPEPVVDFIVRAVDEVLITTFDLEDGLADTSTTTIKEQTQVKDRRSKSGFKSAEKVIPRVQVLDPAVGTGTFLAAAIHQVAEKMEDQSGFWNQYVEEHLLTRFNGFEILMASYAMAHLKLELVLRDTGYTNTNTQRLKVYLTNSLEEYHPDTGTLFASWLSREASEANHIKRDTPVMVVLGNPPYSGISSNMGEWISNLIEEYKFVDGEHFGERKHWLHDDYVKFIRYGQFLVERTGEGVLAYINNHSFIDNPTFRGMRWNLLEAFDEIYVVDLNGSTKKEVLKPDHIETDQNVFDIQQGVSINLFVKHKKNGLKKQASVKYISLWGTRKEKYEWLENSGFSSISWQDVDYKEPNYFFRPTDQEKEEEYNQGVPVDDIFIEYTMGFASAKDKVTVGFTEQEVMEAVSNFREKTESELRSLYGIKKDSRDWKIATAKQDVIDNDDEIYLKLTSYRPFDERYTYYTGNSRGFYASPQKAIMQHLTRSDNFAFCTCRMNRDLSHTYWVAKNIVSKSVISSLDNAYVFPVYLYGDSEQPNIESLVERTPNLNPEYIVKVEGLTGLSFTSEPNEAEGTFSPESVVDYLYGVLYTPNYRDKYKEYLKIDFPKVPLPNNSEMFLRIGEIGHTLRCIHLQQLPGDTNEKVRYPVSGDNVVESPKFDAGKVYINKDQYFEGIDQNLWEMEIGGYAPAQKWLKDRKGRRLTLGDVKSYQQIIARLKATISLMQELDGVHVW